MARIVPDHIASLTPYPPGKPIEEVERELGISGCVKLASNENPLGPSPRALEAISNALSKLHYYPDGGGFYLKSKLSERFEVTPEQIVLGNGSNELLELIIRTFMVPGTNLVSSASTFVIYRLASKAVGYTLREAALGSDRGYDMEALLDAVDENTRLVFIANPNNPTGTYIDRESLEDLVRRMDARCGEDPPILVMDEAYFEFAEAADYPDGLELLRQRPRTIVLRTFSKAYGLAGIRLGYGFTSPELADYINRVRAPFNVSNLALVAGEAALDDIDHLARVVAMNRTEKARVTRELQTRGFEVIPSQTNFVLVDFGRDGVALFKALMAQGVITRPMGVYGLPNCLRITVGTPPQNDTFLKALDHVVDGQGR
jgi:histidinol-phosphate aminotransferase